MVEGWVLWNSMTRQMKRRQINDNRLPRLSNEIVEKLSEIYDDSPDCIAHKHKILVLSRYYSSSRLGRERQPRLAASRVVRAPTQGPRFESVHIHTKFSPLPSLPLPKDSVSPRECKKMGPIRDSNAGPLPYSIKALR
jgi:hypothetical protein